MVIRKYVRSLEANSKKIRTIFQRIKNFLIPSWSDKALEFICCGLSFSINIAKVNKPKSKYMIAASNRYFWLHFLIVLFNLGDLVKDITFTAAVQHFDTNIVQDFETETSSGDKVKF